MNLRGGVLRLCAGWERRDAKMRCGTSMKGLSDERAVRSARGNLCRTRLAREWKCRTLQPRHHRRAVTHINFCAQVDGGARGTGIKPSPKEAGATQRAEMR
jgi:hypothetical protein